MPLKRCSKLIELCLLGNPTELPITNFNIIVDKISNAMDI